MAATVRNLVVVITHGIDHELSSVAFTIADFISRGDALWACTPCVKSRGYAQEDLIDGVVITGASKMHELIADGAATLSF